MKRTWLQSTLVVTALLTAIVTFASDAIPCPQIVTGALQYDQKDSTANLQAFTYLGGYVGVNGASNKTDAEAILNKVTDSYSPEATVFPMFPITAYICVYAPYSKYTFNTPSVFWGKLTMYGSEKSSDHLSTLERATRALK